MWLFIFITHPSLVWWCHPEVLLSRTDFFFPHAWNHTGQGWDEAHHCMARPCLEVFFLSVNWYIVCKLQWYFYIAQKKLRMSSVIKSNILKKSEVTVLTYLIILDLVKLTILIKPVFHNAMWNGINYATVLWFFIDCLTAVFPWLSGKKHNLCDLYLHASILLLLKIVLVLAFINTMQFPIFKAFFLFGFALFCFLIGACVWGISYASYFMLLDANSLDPFSI